MTDRPKARRVAVIGGGVSGLAAAYTLARARQAGAPVEEMLIEASPWLGGVVRTETVNGFVIEAGPDSFLAEKPQAAAMARELGLGDDLMGSNDHARRTYILHQGRLLPLPDGLMFLVPTRLWPMVTTKLLPLSTKLAAARELFSSPPAGDEGDESVASFVQRHFGAAMVENVADPLLAGVYGGDSAALSVRSVLPRFWEMERQHGSLTRATLAAMRQRRKASLNNNNGPDSAGTGTAPPRQLPLFMTLKGGLQQMTERLAAQVERYRVFMRRRALALEFAPGGPGGATDSCSRRFQIACEGDKVFDADAVVLALPAYRAGGLVSSLDHRLSELLEGIPYSSSMTVSLGFDERARAVLPDGFGFLVPRKEHRRMLACTFVHAKFDHRAPEGKAMLRCFLGGARDPDVLELRDEEVVAIVRRELREIMNFIAEPLFFRVHRWPASMAQYPVGHRGRVSAIEERLQDLPGLYLAGNAYSGIGISDCIRTGRSAAEKALEYVGLGSRRAQ
ncbi:MAG TPA: protoporphyrinogen oxidase [Terriglobia bacterium]|nr:protoporphyrinogen oxidase [Terriglobia bacterium]